MARFRLIDRIRYRLDTTLSRGPSALILWLFLLGGALALLGATIVTLSNSAPAGPGGARASFALLTWQGWQRTLNLNVGIGPLFYVLGTFIPTLGSLFIGGIFIGLLTGGIQNRIRNLRRGRSRVIEQGHTVILGWSQHIFQLIVELVQANQNKEDACVVVLAEKDKVEMEDAIHEKVHNLGHTRVVCRTGSPVDLTDLLLVNPDDARVIVVLAPDTKDPDPQVIKTLLALTREQSQAARRCQIVAEIRQPKNRRVAELIGQSYARVLQVDDILARITVQTCRQVGLSAVYAELLGFDGDELYLSSQPTLVGRTFGDALLAFEDSCLVGLQRAGKSLFNPPMDTVIEADDRVIAIAQDDDTIHVLDRSPAELAKAVDESAIRDTPPLTHAAERTLILGWNRRAPLILCELDQYMVPGSELSLVSDAPDAASQAEKLRPKLKNLSLSFRSGDMTDRGLLEALDVPSYHHVIVLGNNDKLSAQEADAVTLITLLHLRDLVEHAPQRPSIVSEIFDTRNRELAEVTRADDVIVGDKLVSQLLAQMAESPDLLLDDLFNADGSELYLRPASEYVRTGVALGFDTIVVAARRRGQVAIGYRLGAEEAQGTRQGVHINPRKSETITLGEHDKIVLLGQC
ncbi:MAG: NAD-binding protein [Myxococcales bacterium]|nr:NAD-binding protein [Myxococcales bacterium]